MKFLYIKHDFTGPDSKRHLGGASWAKSSSMFIIERLEDFENSTSCQAKAERKPCSTSLALHLSHRRSFLSMASFTLLHHHGQSEGGSKREHFTAGHRTSSKKSSQPAELQSKTTTTNQGTSSRSTTTSRSQHLRESGSSTCCTDRCCRECHFTRYSDQ